MNASQRIIEVRKERNVSQYKLAKLTGLSQPALSQLESEKTQPTIQTLEKIISALNMSWSEFFGEATELSPELQSLVNIAKTLTPEQLKALDVFLRTLQ
ncbi:helix-turn-helix domain-containing protein [Eubacterium callanderi]|uniref:helix-turn-helix domain-containing protein n=1 Tax=Eubacterium callanderi TaxID=53442 RepID=UPI003918BB75